VAKLGNEAGVRIARDRRGRILLYALLLATFPPNSKSFACYTYEKDLARGTRARPPVC